MERTLKELYGATDKITEPEACKVIDFVSSDWGLFIN